MEQQMELKVQFIEQKNMLRDELDDIIDEHDNLLDEYGELNEQLHKKDSLIQEQIAEIRNLIRTKSDLKEARRKIETLKSISKKYIANIDSLLALNEQLSNEKDSVINVNKDINWRNYKLNKQNEQLVETVNKGSVLKLENIEVEAIKYKITGKEVTTKQAKKTQKIRVCFSVLANPIANAEAKTVYMQLIDNNGIVIIGNKNVSVSILDNAVIYTDSLQFDYENTEMKHCFEWVRVHMLAAGYYLINIIIEEKVALQTTLKLK
jgi:predicted nuclease with TOPRIM domain